MNDQLYAQVRAILQEKWPSVQDMTLSPEFDPFLFGRFGDVEMQVKTFSTDLPVVRVFVEVGKRVPLTAALIERLNMLNELSTPTSVAIADEAEAPNTVRVSTACSVLAELMDAESIYTAVESVVWPANLLLQQGFLTTYGGELPLLRNLRLMIDAAPEGSDVSGLLATVTELEARVATGDVGRLPSA